MLQIKKTTIIKFSKQYETMGKANLELTAKKNKIDKYSIQQMGWTAGETFIKRELVNQKIELKKFPRMQHREINKWKCKREDKQYEVIQRCNIYPFGSQRDLEQWFLPWLHRTACRTIQLLLPRSHHRRFWFNCSRAWPGLQEFLELPGLF